MIGQVRSRILALAGLFACALCLTPAMADAGGGAKVIRFQDDLEFFIVDTTDGLMTLHGLDQSFAQLCSGVPFTVDDLDIQQIESPTGAFNFLFKGDHSVWVYPAPALPDPNHTGLADCPILAGLPLLASGRARLVRTDNDITLAGPGADAFGWIATGTLTGASGQAMRYGETVRLVVSPSDTNLKELRADIRLVPVGGH